MCALVLLEQRNSLLWECTHESWSSAKTPRTRKLRQGCAVPRPAWLQNCLNSDRGRRPSASFVVRMLYCLRGHTCEPGGAQDESRCILGFDMRQKCKRVFFGLCWDKTISFQQFMRISLRSGFPAQVCTSLSLGDKEAYIRTLSRLFIFGWYLNLQDRQGCLG